MVHSGHEITAALLIQVYIALTSARKSWALYLGMVTSLRGTTTAELGNRLQYVLGSSRPAVVQSELMAPAG